MRNEISVTEDGILLKEHRIIVPQSLRDRVIQLAHQGHQGMTKTKLLLRTEVWFPQMDDKTEQMIKECIPCQATTPQVQRSPLKMTPLPDYPWQKVSVDFCGPFQSGHYILLVMDDYSRYLAIEILMSTSTRATIPRLDKIFAEYGIPEELKSDNGSPFQSQEFPDFAVRLNFHHQRITPLWPEANGEAERFMRTLNKATKTSEIEGRPWRENIWTFLHNYRATPHATTGIAPATALTR